MRLRKVLRPTAAAAVCVMSGWTAGPAAAANLRIENAVSGSVTASDNLRLEPAGSKESGFILGQTGQTSVRADGNRLDAALDLSLDLIETLGSEREVTLRQTGFGFGTAELLEDLLFVEAQGSVQRVLLDPAQSSGLTANPYSTQEDRANAYSLSVSPWLQHDFAGWAQGELRYRRSEVLISEGVGDSSVDEASARLRSGRRFDRLNLDALAERHETESETRTGDLERTTALLDGRWFLFRQFAVVGSAGYETIESPGLTGPPDGAIWTAGIYTRPGPRTELEARFGHRYGGSIWEGSGSYKLSERVVVRASYGESIETTQQSLLSLGYALDPVTNRIIDPRTSLPVEADAGNGLFNQVYRSKQGTVSVTAAFSRTEATLAYTDTVRDFDLRPDDHVRQFSSRIDHRLTPLLSGAVALGYQRYDQSATAEYGTFLGRVELSRRLSTDFRLTGALSHSRREADSGTPGYTETAATVSVRLDF
ncbi:TIGR03016 family PEP-CTERM system-associated outer membrane protein [Arenibaculum pallidiluteum]|uniref:TIGR03016 family PEP-CTERM system-associated outer membrane protein n=1 Tax=Arenibaculum pallidiluteum TaxID=2812559 RepID=UPI001A96913E|nr:TIGR03016 family PEP-CTERM system-associated outer membrane protein [Arenibaculum pallidiluteum]